MCRSLAEGGRRCPCGHGDTRARMAARQRSSRARRGLAAAEAAGDTAAAAIHRARLDEATGALAQMRQTHPNDAAYPTAPATTQQVEASIRDAYHAVLADRSDPTARWVDLADLRAHLSHDLDRATVDRVLDKMIESPEVSLMAQLNQITLTPQRDDAAVVIGDEPRH